MIRSLASFIVSSVLGQIVSETTGTGAKKSTYVYGAGSLVAQQSTFVGETVLWRYTDASGLSSRGAGNSWELDGLGNNVGTLPNLTPPIRSQNSYSPMQGITFDDMSMGDCSLDGIITPCSMALGSIEGVELIVGQRRDARGRWTDVTVGADLGFRGNGSYRFFIPGVERDIADSPDDPDNLIFRTVESPGQWFSFQVASWGGNNRNETNTQTNSKLCKSLAAKLDQYARFFEGLWTESGSGTENVLEKGGLIGMDASARVSAGGIEPIKTMKYTGKTYSDTMGSDFTKWILAEIGASGKNNFAILFIVHTHPLYGRPAPSEKVLQNGEKTGDKPVSSLTGLDGIVVTRSKLGIYNEAGRYCELDRTPTSVIVPR